LVEIQTLHKTLVSPKR
jgi:hypothetical protein